MSVRETIREVPPFHILLPAGWTEHPADRDSIARLTEQSRAVFKSQHRPDLDSEFTRMMGLANRRMKQAGVFAIYLQTSVPEDDLLPMSMTASIVRGRLGGSLDRQVSSLIRENGAGFLTDDHRILRWAADTVQTGDLEGIATRLIDYLIAVPGMERREAVQFTTTLPYPVGDESAAELVQQMELLSDTIVSTFVWEAGAR